MANFVLIDHWLDRMGGHNYQYALEILAAAEKLGYQPVLAVQKCFVRTAELPAHWRVERLFRYGPNRRHWAGVDGTSKHAIGLDGRWLNEGRTPWLARALDVFRFYRADRQKRLADFEDACGALFNGIGWCAADVVFLPTLSEFDLLGVARFLKAQPQSQALDWHLQLHFDLFRGREPEHDAQRATRDLIRRQMAAALAEIPHHRLHFYGTTEEMCRQYNRIQVASFRTLPYPAGPAYFQNDRFPPETRRPLRATLAGMPRREKGKRRVTELVRGLWSDYLSQGKVQLLLQLDQRQIHRLLPKQAAEATRLSDHPRTDVAHPIVSVKHPLEAHEYVELITGSDIGIFAYDSLRYHSRCSGILVEMLAAGVPVIVPAGCWLAEQISEPIYEHLDTLRRTAAVLDEIDAAPSRWRGPRQRGDRDDSPSGVCFGGSRESAGAEFAVPDGAVSAIVSFHGDLQNAPGSYVRVEAHTAGRDDESSAHASIVGARRGGGPVGVMIRWDKTPRKLPLRLHNAYHALPLRVRDVRITYLAEPQDGAGGYPAGKVGLIAAETKQYTALLREMIAHYSHYRRSARDFSKSWSDAHAPQRTVEALLANSAPGTHSKLDSDAA